MWGLVSRVRCGNCARDPPRGRRRESRRASIACSVARTAAPPTDRRRRSSTRATRAPAPSDLRSSRYLCPGIPETEWRAPDFSRLDCVLRQVVDQQHDRAPSWSWPHFDTMRDRREDGDGGARDLSDAGSRFFGARAGDRGTLPPELDLVLSTAAAGLCSTKRRCRFWFRGPIFWLRVEPEEVLDRCRRPWAARRPPRRTARTLSASRGCSKSGSRHARGRAGAGDSRIRAEAAHILALLAKRDDFGRILRRSGE
jgi:hypothetical protein